LINPDLSCWPLLRCATGFHSNVWHGNRRYCVRRTCPYFISRFAAIQFYCVLYLNVFSFKTLY
jgi:hypothetical protein